MTTEREQPETQALSPVFKDKTLETFRSRAREARVLKALFEPASFDGDPAASR